MPPNPERQARLRAKRDEMANDPDLAEAMRNASAAVLAGPAGGSDEGEENLASGVAPEDLESETSADKEKSRGSGGGSFGVAPPLSQPPIGRPTVAGEPIVRPNPRVAPRMTMPRAGGSTQRMMTAAPSDEAVPGPLSITPDLRAQNPLGLSANTPFKYAGGGKVTKHGSSTSVSCKAKHGG
jgi:hypothetical protein